MKKEFCVNNNTSIKKIIRAMKRNKKIVLINEERMSSKILDIVKIYNTLDYKDKLGLIYDYVCDYIDEDMRINNYCDFKDDRCIGNRLGLSVHSINGCCYRRKEGLCKKFVNKKCVIRNVSCKFFMCTYVEKKMKKKYDPKNIIPLMFLDRRQINIMKRSYFIEKEIVIEKLYKK